MDLYDPQRHLVYSGTAARKHGFEWRDLMLSLLDNFGMSYRRFKIRLPNKTTSTSVIITCPEVRGGRTYNVLISRVSITAMHPDRKGADISPRSPLDKPIPVECLGLGNFKDEPSSRREENGSSRLLSSITKPSRPIYPFTIFHRLDVKRRYTFYVEKETLRTKWHEAFIDAMAVRQTERDVNKWYAPDVIDDGTFVSKTPSVPTDSTAHFTGRIMSATTFGEIA